MNSQTHFKTGRTAVGLCLVALIVISWLALGNSQAQSVPPLINYQGRLTDASGVPLPAGAYGVAFRLWDTQSLVAGQTLVWGREYDVTIIEGGAFNVILGAPGGRTLPDIPPPAVNDLGFGFGQSNRFLGLTIARDGNGQAVPNPRELVPRQQILSVPFAVQAQQAQLAQQAQVASSLITNLANALCPPGSIMAYMGTNPPPGWLLCDGSTVSRSQFAPLFSVIGTSSGNGNGSTTFGVPDLRGMFLRGVTGSRTDAFADPDRSSRIVSASGGGAGNNVGSVQVDGVGSHQHYLFVGSVSLSLGGNANTVYNSGPTISTVSYTVANGPGIGSETRPKNAYVNYIIKY